MVSDTTSGFFCKSAWYIPSTFLIEWRFAGFPFYRQEFPAVSYQLKTYPCKCICIQELNYLHDLDLSTKLLPGDGFHSIPATIYAALHVKKTRQEVPCVG